jgi:TPR repeat protein
MYIDPSVSLKLSTLMTQLNAQQASLTAPLNTTLTELAEAAKHVGSELLRREKFADAAFYLTFPALRGDADSQYAMATCTGYIFGAFRYAFPETKKWLRLAAAQNHIHALMWLGDAESLTKARELSMAAVAMGDPQGMLNLYTMTQDIKWLNQAAATGKPGAQFKLAQAYREHPGLVTNAIERNALIEELCQKSADSGYPPALYDRVYPRASSASIAEKQQRLAQLASIGELEGMQEYAYALAGMPWKGAVTARTYGLEKDLPKACALLKFARNRMAEVEPVTRLDDDIEQISHQMTAQQYEASLLILSELNANVPLAPRFHEPKVVLGAGN